MFWGGPDPSREVALDKSKKYIVFFLGKSSKQKAMAFIAMDDLMGETPHLVRWFSQL